MLEHLLGGVRKRRQKPLKYGVILDAGSSGTRVYIYKWHDHTYQRLDASTEELNGLPEITTKKKWTKKIHPGISTFADKVENVGPDHLASLFSHALDIIPEDQVANTPLFLLATAGVRLLPKFKRESLLREVCNYARTETKFLLPDCALHIQAIPGETEGLYGWVAANYLLDSFDATARHQHGKGHHTYGFLDMGGASAQIAFAPNQTEAAKHSEDLKLVRLRKLNGKAMEFKVFVTTWLGFGVNEARTKYINELVKNSGGKGILEIPEPCLQNGLKATIDGLVVDDTDAEQAIKAASAKYPYLIGTGKFEECQHQVHSLLSDGIPCDHSGCLLTSHHFPKIDFNINHFLGVSEYWHTTQEVFEMLHDTKAYDLATYSQRVREFCSSSWQDIENLEVETKKGHMKKIDAEKVMKICFKASWMMNVLHDGLGIPRIGIETSGDGHNGTEGLIEGAKDKGFLDSFQAVDKIDDVEVSWTLGKMVMYAASTVPPAKDTNGKNALPVGIGSNKGYSMNGGMPDDFEYASFYQPTKVDNTPTPTYTMPYSVSGYSTAHASSTDHLTGQNDLDHWHAALWNNTNSRRRIPGLILFMFMLSIAVYLLLGRERRGRILRRFQGSLPRILHTKRRRVMSSAGGVAYDRLMEEGDIDIEISAAGTTAVANPNSFELDDYDDDNHSSGSSNDGSVRLSAPSHTVGLGLRMGNRIASRERLALSRSRDVSPLRPSISGRRVSSKSPNPNDYV